MLKEPIKVTQISLKLTATVCPENQCNETELYNIKKKDSKFVYLDKIVLF